MVRGFVLVAALALCLGPARAIAQQGAPAYPHPKYQVLPFNEDWSVLAHEDPNRPDDIFDPIKYIALTDDGKVWASFGGQYRMRLEGWTRFNFGAPPTADDDDVFVLNRALYHLDLHLGEQFRIFVQGKSAFCTSRDLVGGCRTLDADEFDLQNGFIDAMIPLPADADLTIRVGRQELLFGKQRLASPLDWSNTRRTFDGVSAIVKAGAWTATGFLTRPVTVLKYDANEPNEDVDFYGIYASRTVARMKGGFDLYWLGLHRNKAGFNGTTGEEKRQTLGARAWGKIGDSDFDYDMEGAFQFGTIGPGNIHAYMVSTNLGYTFGDTRGKPRLYAGYDYASGDGGVGDADVQTFNQLFPLGHAYFGYIDTVARQNISSPNVGISYAPVYKALLKAEYLYFWRASDNDALYNAGGGVARPGSSGTSRDIGSEIDLTASYQLDLHTQLIGGYSRFFAEEFIRQSGPSKDINFLYFIFQYTF
ncbi:MAG: alginate export family protein [Deltaproteobacteria bacterium]|nr:alginate export family protein [Deltaproteobacteria bacterium]